MLGVELPDEPEIKGHVIKVPLGIKPHMVSHRQVNKTKVCIM
jgi:hypothetical protein